MSADFTNFESEISDLLDGVFVAKDEGISDDEYDTSSVDDDTRERILSKVDMSDMNSEEYAVFMDYGIANAVNIFHKSAGKVPERNVVLEIVSNALSHAIVTYNIDIAKEKKAAFRTHYGWKIREAATTYFRDLEKGRKNVLKGDDEDGKSRDDFALQSDQFGNENKEGSSAYERPEWEDTNRSEYERFKKLEWCMRQVRHELSRESNLILDVEIGEVTDFEGKKIPLSQFAKLTEQSYPHVRKIRDRALALIKQKMARKGYIALVLDDEKTVEDLHKETNIKEAIERFEESENIIATSDAKSILETIDEELNVDALSTMFGGSK